MPRTKKSADDTPSLIFRCRNEPAFKK